MTPELEQLADEAIELRCSDVERGLTRHHIPAGLPGASSDHLDRSRRLIGDTWATQRPALAQLADARLEAIGRLAAQGVTPEPDCTVTVGRVTLHTVSSLHPVSHRYEVMRGRERAGWAWLSDAGGFDYVVRLDSPFCPDPIGGQSLARALDRAATRLNAVPLAEAGAR